MAVYTQRTNATAIPESMLDFLMSKVVTVGGVFDVANNHLKVVQQSVPDMTVKISVGSAFLFKSGQAKVYPVYVDATSNVTIDANSSGATRNDAIVCYLNLGLTANADATNVVQFVAVKGASGGSAPSDANIETALGASNPYIRLANVEVINGATSIPTAKITDTRVSATYSTLVIPTPILTTTSYAPEGFLINGKISVTVASNNITVAIKTMAGADPTSTTPVYVRIDGVVRTITSALSVTKNAGTNWFNAGSSELATKAIDYFVYLGYNATDGVVIGFARIPYATIYSDFSATTTNEKYCAISTIASAVAGDNYVVIGRFEATLSAGAGYTWSVPTFTSKNLIQRPIFKTRWLEYVPTKTAEGSMTISSSNERARYFIDEAYCHVNFSAVVTLGGSASYQYKLTTPITNLGTGASDRVGGGSADHSNGSHSLVHVTGDAPNNIIYVRNTNSANYSLSSTWHHVHCMFQII